MEACVIGAGNRWREDDGIGPAVIEKLTILISGENTDIFCIEERVFELQFYFDRYKKIVLIDALPPETEPGKIKIRRVNGSDISLRRRLPQSINNVFSLHDLDLLWQVQSAFRNGYQGKLMLIGIEAGSLGYGEGLSPQLTIVLPMVLFKLEQRIRADDLNILASFITSVGDQLALKAAKLSIQDTQNNTKQQILLLEEQIKRLKDSLK